MEIEELLARVQATPHEIKERLEKGGNVFLLDVREPQEFEFARIEGACLIPLGDLPNRYEEIERDAEIVVYCHHGIRSLQAAVFLLQKGFTQVKNLAGGIDAWSLQADPQVPRYE